MLSKIFGFVATLVSAGSFFLSWGTTHGSSSTPFATMHYTMHHTGKAAGPFGFLTIGLASLAAVMWLVSLSSKAARGVVTGQIWVSAIGAVLVVLALVTHPQIGWPLGPDLAIAGFAASVFCAIFVLRKTQEQDTPISS